MLEMDKDKRGKALLPEEKKYIVLLKDYFDRNRAEFGSKDPSAQQVADALDVGLATVRRVLASYKKDPESINISPAAYRGRPTYALDASLQEIVRTCIREANLQGQHITLETIRDYIQDKSPEEFHISTLARTLDRWGFEFGKGTRTQHLKEKDYVVVARHRYLRRMRNNRLPGKEMGTIRPEVYLDESYVNKNHSNDYIWYSSEDGPWIQKPTGKGERLILINAITQNGWVPNAKLLFKSSRKTGDYHGQVNWELFKKWFVEKLIPNIPANSFIIMDNAPYHNVLSDTSSPIASSSKAVIKEWLETNGIPCKEDCLKVELVEVLKKIAPVPTYEIDEIAKKYGHEIVRTPPYHPELQPIEVCWGVLKNEVARHCDFTMGNLLDQLELAFSKVTSDTCKKIIKRVKKIEDKFWEEDAKLEEIL
jgi:transposase